MSTLPPGKKIVNGHVINKDETLCTFSFVHNPSQQQNGMFAYPVEVRTSSDPEEKNKNIAPVKIRNLIIKTDGNYEYYDYNGIHDLRRNMFLKERYALQKNKYTDGALTQEEEEQLELRGGSKRKSKSQRRKKSKSQRRKKSIKRRH